MNPSGDQTSRSRRCAVDGCEAPVSGKGLCNRHYQRQRRRGTTGPLPRPADGERFEANVNRSGPVPAHRPELGPCWLWTGGQHSKGYGKFDGTLLAHRVAYELFVGPIATGLQIDHLCRNHICVNPTHLEPVTQRENILRGESPVAEHARREICKRGHPLAGDNLYVVPRTGARRCRACVALREAERAA